MLGLIYDNKKKVETLIGTNSTDGGSSRSHHEIIFNLLKLIKSRGWLIHRPPVTLGSSQYED